MKKSYWMVLSYSGVNSGFRGPFPTNNEVYLRMELAMEGIELDTGADCVIVLEMSGNKIKNNWMLNFDALYPAKEEIEKIDDTSKKKLPLIISSLKTPEAKMYLNQVLKRKS